MKCVTFCHGVITINYQCDYTINQQSLNVTINYIKY